MKTKEILMRNILNNITGNLFRTFLAEEPVASPSKPEGEGQVSPEAQAKPKTEDKTLNYEELISMARTEEKNKLYPELNALKTKVNELTKKNNELLLSLGTKEQEIKEAKSQKTPASENKEIKELNNKIAQLETALNEKDTEISSIKLNHLKESKIAELDGKVIPELIFGNTEEEILASIENSKKKYAEIEAKIAGSLHVKSGDMLNAQSTQVGTVPPANPDMTEVFHNNIDSMDISKLDMFNPSDRAKYEAFRKQSGLI